MAKGFEVVDARVPASTGFRDNDVSCLCSFVGVLQKLLQPGPYKPYEITYNIVSSNKFQDQRTCGQFRQHHLQ